ncbi:hypothetical protein GALMADRAFT_223752 [Galerina marginata CBS 339.88]|uniref:Uncharacterized protein n=1 Tax=Galerina marginata (strain CBS 339.88) TaxID=685588 RepID=A0A067TI79_GALM3|nr:hypothetical protein GALMADRAFT_223752 [Galerina marginata CBS 339.88]
MTGTFIFISVLSILGRLLHALIKTSYWSKWTSKLSELFFIDHPSHYSQSSQTLRRIASEPRRSTKANRLICDDLICAKFLLHPIRLSAYQIVIGRRILYRPCILPSNFPHLHDSKVGQVLQEI